MLVELQDTLLRQELELPSASEDAEDTLLAEIQAMQESVTDGDGANRAALDEG